MRDLLEQQLAARLRDVGAAVPDVLEPPADLEERVARRRRRGSSSRRLSVLAVAAAVVGAIAIVSVVAPAPDEGTLVSTNGGGLTAVNRLRDTAMLDARDAYVVALDRDGHQIGTLVTAGRGKVVDAQLTADHRTLWYLSVAGRAGTDCGELVRADIATGDSEIVGHAVAFGINRDGTRVALSGRGECAPASGAQLAVRDLVTDRLSTADAAAPPTAISWSPAGDRLVTSTCAGTCAALQTFAVPPALGPPLESSGLDVAGTAAFGPDGLYIVASPVLRFDAASLLYETTVLTDESRDLLQVVPTASGTMVVARAHGAPSTEPPGLFRVERGALREVRQPFAFGTLSPVP